MNRHTLVSRAAMATGLPDAPVELLREGSHGLYRLAGGVVARVGQPGTGGDAQRELVTARWLGAEGIDVIRPMEVAQPTVVDDQPVTWWEELPEHRPASPGELGAVLRRLHALPIPDFPSLPELDPFAGFAHRIDRANLAPGEREWLHTHLEQLWERWTHLSPARPPGVVHGDAWQGNVAVTGDGRVVLLDLDHVSIGPAEWDLVPVAVDHTDFARIDDAGYRSFVHAYSGYDVTTWSGYRTLADVAELGWTCFSLDRALHDDSAASEARHRLACLRGEIPRPWTWRAL